MVVFPWSTCILSRAEGDELGKVAEAKLQALNGGWLPSQDKGTAVFSCAVFKAPFLLLDFGLLFVQEHTLISLFLFF